MEEKEIALAALGVIVTLSQRPPPEDNSKPTGKTELPIKGQFRDNPAPPITPAIEASTMLLPTKELTEPPPPPEPPTCLAGV